MSLVPNSKRVQLDTGLDYHYLEWDQADHRHTLVLVHGFLDFCSGWRATVDPDLYQHFHVVAPDMRGHGDTDHIGAGGYYHFFDYVADLRSFILKVGRDKVSLVGHSMGGSIAGYYAGTYPDELAKLVLMEGMGPPDDHTPPPDRIKQWVRGWKRATSRSPHLYQDIDAAAAKLRSRDPLLSHALSQDLATWGTHSVAGGQRVFKHDPLHLSLGPIGYDVETAKSFWKRIACPVLLVEGAESTLNHAPAEADRRNSALQDATQIQIPGAGHMMQRHQPAEVAKILLDFLS